MPTDHPAGQDGSTRPRVIVSVTATADGRVTLSRIERLLDDGPNLRWKAMWPPDADDLLTRRAAAIEQRHHPAVVLEGSGTFVADAGSLQLPDANVPADVLRTDFLPYRSPRWFAVVDTRGRVAWTHKGDEETSLLVIASHHSTPLPYLGHLRQERIPYLLAGARRADLTSALEKLRTQLGVTCLFGVAKGLSHLPELKEIGFTASRRLLDVQRISHDPAEGAAALAALTQPVISPAGTRTAGMPIISPRVQALLAALCVFRLLPGGFTNRDLRTCLAPLLGLTPEAMTSGQLTYDLRRLRIHGLIQRIPHSFRYQVTPAGLRQALFLTRLTQRLLIPGLSQLTDPSPPVPAPLRAAARAYDTAIDELTRQALLAA